jgi:formyl-CoA transferase
MPKALEGLKVLDLTQFEAGPSCTEYLAFLGADVVKIEPPGKGEPGRKAGLSKAEREKGYHDSWYFILLNASKRGITLNLKSKKGTAIFKAMVKKADVVVSNFLPGTMDKLGIGYDVLRNIHPGLVYAENSGFGTGGPYSAYPCFDAIAKAAGSAFSNTGMANGPPLNPGPSIGDTGAGVHMAVAILAALRYRDMTGEGQQIDMAMADNIINLNRIFFRRPLDFGEPQPRAGGGSAGSCPWDTFRCKGDKPNDYIFIGAPMAHQYEALMKQVGREDLVEGLKDDGEARWQKRAVIKEAIETWTKTKDKMEAFHTLAKAGIPTGPVLDTLEVLNDPHFIQRGMVLEMHHQERGRHKMLGCPVHMSRSTPEYTPAPSLGQHNEEVYTEWMEYTKEDVARLQAEQVI